MKNTRVSMVMDCRKAIFEAPSRGARPPSGAQSRALAGRNEKMRPKAGGISHVGRGAHPTAPKGGRAPQDHMVAPGNLFHKSSNIHAFWFHRWIPTEPRKRILPLLALLVIALALPASAQRVEVRTGSAQYSGVPITERELEQNIQGVKRLKLGEDSPEDVMRKLGQPENRARQVGLAEIWNYKFVVDYESKNLYQVNILVRFGSNGLLGEVIVDKIKENQLQTLYSQSVSAEVAAPSNAPSEFMKTYSAAPENPRPGQIYFNSSNRHFFGWNGSAWVRLDAGGQMFLK